MRTRISLTRMLPCRVDASGLPATWIWSCALPWPDAGASPVIQPASEEAFHVHSGWVVTSTVVVAPLALTGEVGATTVIEHLTGEGPVDVATEEPQAAIVAHSAAQPIK